MATYANVCNRRYETWAGLSPAANTVGGMITLPTRLLPSRSRGFRRVLQSIPHRGHLLRTALLGGSRKAITASQRQRNRVADIDAWNVDYWFDDCAAQLLRWHLSDRPQGYINFSGTRWEEQQWSDPDNPLWSRELESQILTPILDALEINLDDVEDILEEDPKVSPRARRTAYADLVERKRLARVEFAELVSVLWD